MDLTPAAGELLRCPFIATLAAPREVLPYDSLLLGREHSDAFIVSQGPLCKLTTERALVHVTLLWFSSEILTFFSLLLSSYLLIVLLNLIMQVPIVLGLREAVGASSIVVRPVPYLIHLLEALSTLNTLVLDHSEGVATARGLVKVTAEAPPNDLAAVPQLI